MKGLYYWAVLAVLAAVIRLGQLSITFNLYESISYGPYVTLLS
jgi:hypothetical protein